MAERRMFAKSLIDSDLFLDMPPTTQMLYFHLYAENITQFYTEPAK